MAEQSPAELHSWLKWMKEATFEGMNPLHMAIWNSNLNAVKAVVPT